MGAGESKGQSAEAAADTVDYYQLLEVDENATADEIKVIFLFFLSPISHL